MKRNKKRRRKGDARKVDAMLCVRSWAVSFRRAFGKPRSSAASLQLRECWTERIPYVTV